MWLLLWMSLASAIEIPSKADMDIGVGCVVHAQDKNPILVLDGKRYTLQDDGVAPDDISLDGFFSGFVSTSVERMVQAQVLGDGNRILWTGDIPFPPKGQQTWLLIDEEQHGERPLVQVEFRSIASTSTPTGVHQQRWWMFWVLPLFGFVLGWYTRRTSSVDMRFWTSTTGAWNSEKRLCVVESEPEFLAEVERCAQGRLTLLCTSEERLPIFSSIADRDSLFVMNTQKQCEAHSLYAQLSMLESLGDAVLIVDGVHGLVEPLSSEPPSRVVQEILDASAHQVCVFFTRDSVLDGIQIAEEDRDPTT